MNYTPTGMVVGIFHDQKSAKRLYETLLDRARMGVVHLEESAYILCREDGSVQVDEPEEKQTAKGAGVGAVIGGLVGLLIGPAGVVVGAGAGAVVGGMVASNRSGIPDESVKEISDALTPGSAAVIAVFKREDVENAPLAQTGNDVLVATLGEDIAAQLAAGEDVAYASVFTEQGAQFERVSIAEELSAADKK